MKFKGKVDLWIWIVLMFGEVLILLALFSPEGGWIIGLVTAFFYNILILPFLIRNYVEVTDEKLTLVFGFSKESIVISEIVEVYRTHNPISSSAASLDRIVIKGKYKSILCALKEREEFFNYLQEKNPNIIFANCGEGFKETKAGKVGIIFSVVICIIVGILLFTGNVHVEYKESSFVIEATYWYDKEIDYEEVQSIEYRDEKVEGSRTGGWGSFRLLLGDFSSNELGNYTRYTYANCDAGIILMVNDREVVVSGKDAEGTYEIYEELILRCGLQGDN